MSIRNLLSVGTALGLLASGEAAAQGLYLPLPADSMDVLLTSAEIGIEGLTGTRGQGDRTDRGMLIFDDSTSFMAQLAAAPSGGEEFNNQPRYELAAYDLQRLYLPESELVVPPTAMRAFDYEWYRTMDRDVERTFRGVNSVVVLIQAWLNFTTAEDVWDEDRFESDPLYARNWANLNLFTYLIRHSDSNSENVRISSFPIDPRLFAVDNGVAFNSLDSDRGTRWRNLLVDRFPVSTVQALRGLTEEQLHAELGVLVQFEIRDDRLVEVPRGENIDARRGVRRRDGVVQFGLTSDEIDDTWYRIESFLRNIDAGLYSTF